MARVAVSILNLVVLTGCSLIAPAQKPVVATVPRFSNQGRRQIALQRMADAAANGVASDLQSRIANDAYGNCVSLEQGRPGLPAAVP